MNISVYGNSAALGRAAAVRCAEIIRETIEEKGKARIVLSTGASQFETLGELVKMDVEWGKVEMFHLDEYIGLPEDHPASFRKYLKDRFLSKVNIQKVYLVDGEGDPAKVIAGLTAEIRREPVDLGLVGIGENAHIAFNDPPADFDTKEAYICVNLDDTCKQQQVREGWFATPDDVPAQAITMTAFQIMQCRRIISSVPSAVKAIAIRNMLESPLTNRIPATILKKHSDIGIYLDRNSASRTDLSMYVLPQQPFENFPLT